MAIIALCYHNFLEDILGVSTADLLGVSYIYLSYVLFVDVDGDVLV